MQRWVHADVRVPDAAAILASRFRAVLDQEWANMLAPQLPHLPPVADYWATHSFGEHEPFEWRRDRPGIHVPVMRIVGGKWAGRSLVSPGGRVRPTAEPLRAALMSLIEADLEGATILDLFAGTGALGLEALSRGAARCDFIENGPAALHSLKANVAAFRLHDRARIFDRDAIPFIERIDRVAYDIAFADPPYGSGKLDRVLRRWRQAPFSRILAFEHAVDHRPGPKGETVRVGDSMVTVLRAPAEV